VQTTGQTKKEHPKRKNISEIGGKELRKQALIFANRMAFLMMSTQPISFNLKLLFRLFFSSFYVTGRVTR
jgi:hypothetical protein